jgi:hypothetical protein
MSKPEDFQDRKTNRRDKLNKSKNSKYKTNYEDDDIKQHKIKKEIKKIKESYQDEEWEDWDNYYN